MSSYLPIAVALIAGLFVVLGCFVQKHLERKQTLADKRRESYAKYFKSMYENIKSMYENIDNRRRGELDDVATEVYLKTQILLYATDEVVRLFGELQHLLTPTGPPEGKEQEIRVKFDTLLLAMRQETVRETLLSIEEIRIQKAV